MHVWGKPRPYTHTRRGVSFPPQYHTSYNWELILSPNTYRYFLRVLCTVRSVTTLDCVPLKDSNRTFVAGLGPEINYRACLCVIQANMPLCQMLVMHPAVCLLFDILPRDPQGRLRYSAINFWTEPPLASVSAISFPRTPARPSSRNSDIPYLHDYKQVTSNSKGKQIFFTVLRGSLLCYKQPANSTYTVAN
jgi:hypothetical protein